MTPQAAREAAELLWHHRSAGTVLHELPPGLRPSHHAEGHTIQAELPGIAGQRVVGWKIAATSTAGQAHINVGGPLAGRILSGGVLDHGMAVSLAGNRMRVVEPEFAFRMARNLPARAAPYAIDEVLDAVASLHPAFEVPDSRFAEFTCAGQAQLIADTACCGPFVFGPAAPAHWRELDLRSHRVRGTVSSDATGVRFMREGEGRAALGDPRVALTWLVNELSALGLTLEAGHFVSTGTCMVPLEVQPGDTVHANYGVLGSLTLRLSE
jgi:2-keto-4-pentenoate hydratase